MRLHFVLVPANGMTDCENEDNGKLFVDIFLIVIAEAVLWGKPANRPLIDTRAICGKDTIF